MRYFLQFRKVCAAYPQQSKKKIHLKKQVHLLGKCNCFLNRS